MTVADRAEFEDLDEDMAALREAVRRFATDRIAPRAAEIDRSDTFPRDL